MTSRLQEGEELFAYQISTRYLNPRGQVITISGCWKQTSAIFKFYYWFRRTPHRHRHVILHWPTKFYANRMIADGVMTSYWFYKMTAIASQIYFRFLVWPPPTCRKAKGYRHTKFRPDTWIHGRDITTSGFWKQTASILKFYFRFRFWLFHYHRHVILHWPTKFYANRMIADGVMTLYLFYKMAAIASQIYFRCLIWPCLIFRKA